jgi:hypothetical protein
MAHFFNRFQKTVYNGYVCKNIMARIRIAQALDEDNLALLPYTLKDGDRPDNIAFSYYGDPHMDWIIYITNNILDPHFDWPLDEKSLQEFIRNKYGSIDAAQKKILFYRVDWAADETTLLPEQYAALAEGAKKYWSPTLGLGNQVVFYERKKVDWQVSTNRVIELTVDTVNNFVSGERVNGNSGVGLGDIVFINTADNKLTLKNIEGTGAFANSMVIVGDTSGASATISDVITIATAIDPAESIYWNSVTAWDFQQEENVRKKQIVLLDKSFASGLDQILTQVLAS